MTRGPKPVQLTGHEFLERGMTWSPTPHDILSQQKEWYVYSKDQPNQESSEFPNV